MKEDDTVARFNSVNSKRWIRRWVEVPLDLDTCPICNQKFSYIGFPMTNLIEGAYPEKPMECQVCKAEGYITWNPAETIGQLTLRSMPTEVH